MKVNHPLVDKAIEAVNKLVKSWGYKRRCDESRRLNVYGSCGNMTLGDFRFLTRELPDDVLIELSFNNDTGWKQNSGWLYHLSTMELREEGKITLTAGTYSRSDEPSPDWK